MDSSSFNQLAHGAAGERVALFGTMELDQGNSTPAFDDDGGVSSHVSPLTRAEATGRSTRPPQP